MAAYQIFFHSFFFSSIYVSIYLLMPVLLFTQETEISDNDIELFRMKAACAKCQCKKSNLDVIHLRGTPWKIKTIFLAI